MQELSFANRIMQNNEVLSVKEKKIARFLIENKKLIQTMSITEISLKTDSSNSTVSRFITKLGYSSFGDFKSMVSREDSTEKSSNDVTATIAHYYSQIIQSASELIDLKQLSKLVKAIKKSKQVMICGIGNSGLSAIELKYRLTRVGIYADALTDPHMLLMRISLMNKDDVLIVLSNSGKTKAILDACEFAKDKHIPIYAVTNQNHTLLTKLADVVLYASKNSLVLDDKFINSQLVTHFVLDVLCYMLLDEQRFFDKHHETLKAINLD